MNQQLMKRLGVVIVSFIIGLILTEGMVRLVGTNSAEYGAYYFFFTALCLGVAVGIWIDKFAGTEMLPK
jgi:hypothetical protein